MCVWKRQENNVIELIQTVINCNNKGENLDNGQNIRPFSFENKKKKIFLISFFDNEFIGELNEAARCRRIEFWREKKKKVENWIKFLVTF